MTSEYVMLHIVKSQPKRRGFLLLASLVIVAVVACSEANQAEETVFLIRVQESVLSPLAFKKAFEIKKGAYSHNEMTDPAALKEAQFRLLNQLVEEMIIVQRAQELNIKVSPSELEAAEAEIIKDYPKGAFEQVLLENAVSYQNWKERLKVRLVVEKVIEQELKDSVHISTKDILDYYASHYGVDLDFDVKPNDINSVIVKRLRREKAENAYRAWIERLRKKYTVEINKAEWEKIINP